MNLRTLRCIATLLLTLAWLPLAADAQPQARIPRIGVLELNSRAYPTPALPAFEQGLRDLGYVEGKDVILEYRYADGKADRLRALAAELVELEPDVLWLHANPAVQAAMATTRTIPIVVAVSDGLVENGFVASLAQPGGNVTGLELPPIASGRRLQLLREAVPAIARVAVLVDPAWQGHADARSEIERDARALGIRLQFVEARSPAGFDAAFAAMVEGGADALMFMKSALFAVKRRQLVALAIRNRLPTMAFALPFAEEGSLMAYGTDPRAMARRSASFVQKILEGARAADLPIERAAPRLIVNLETANRLGIEISPQTLFQADHVIR